MEVDIFKWKCLKLPLFLHISAYVYEIKNITIILILTFGQFDGAVIVFALY